MQNKVSQKDINKYVGKFVKFTMLEQEMFGKIEKFLPEYHTFLVPKPLYADGIYRNQQFQLEIELNEIELIVEECQECHNGYIVEKMSGTVCSSDECRHFECY